MMVNEKENIKAREAKALFDDLAEDDEDNGRRYW